MFDFDAFRNPPAAFRGTDFWMLNDALDEDGIRHQLREMKTQGVASFIARTYIGLKSDYPGPQFKQKLRLIVETARELELKLFLQAGYMPEAVLDLPPHLALVNLKIIPEATTANRKVLVRYQNYAFVAENTGTFLDMFSPAACQFYLKQSYEDMWCDFKDEFGKTISSIWVDEPSYSASALPWSPVILQKFQARWGYDIHQEIPKLFFDIDNYQSVRYHYWITAQELLRDAYFVQVRDWCKQNNLLFSGHLMMEDTLELQLRRAAAAMPYYKYFDIPGIDCLMAAMDFKDMPLPDRFGLPQPRPVMYTTPLQCTSAAHQAGQTHILAEMYGVSSQNLTMRDQKNMFDHFAALGINHRSVHGIFYSLRGRGKRAYPPHINYYQPYWSEYRMLTDYCARASYFVSCGLPVKPVMVIHPLSSAAAEYRAPGAPDGLSRALTVRDTDFLSLQTDLLYALIDFEFADEDTLAMWGKVETVDGNVYLQVGQMRYRSVVLPNLIALAKSTAKLLREFLAAGGHVCVLGQAPQWVDGWASDYAQAALAGAKYFDDRSSLCEELMQFPREYSLSAHNDRASIMVNYRRDKDCGYFFIFNADCGDGQALTLTLPGPAAVSVADAAGDWQPVAGETHEKQSHFMLTLPAGGSLMALARFGQPPVSVSAGAAYAVQPLSGPWDLTLKHPNALVLEFCRFRRQNDAQWSNVYPVLAVDEILSAQGYAGPLTLQFDFSAGVALKNIQLVLESPREQQIWLDGKTVDNTAAGYFWAREFECVALPDFGAGEHTLTLKRDYRPLSKARSAITSLFEHQRGVELEAIALIGDFAVLSRQKHVFNAVGMRMDRHFRLAATPATVNGELVNAGFPFYTGNAVLRRVFAPDAALAGKSSLLHLDGVNACAVIVRLDGTDMGCVAWHPYTVNLGILSHGEHVLELELINTLRNYLGPWHRPKGEYGECWGGGYESPNLAWLGAEDEYTRLPIAGWYDHRDPDTSAWTEDYMQIPLGIRQVRLQTVH